MKRTIGTILSAIFVFVSIVCAGGLYPAIAEQETAANYAPVDTQSAETSAPSEDVDSIEPMYQDVPRVDIDGDMTGISKQDSKNVTITYASETASFTSYASIKWQGTSSVSMGYPKYNYAITLFEDEEHSVADTHQFRTWNAANEYCLKANWIDSTHARNIVGARLAASIQTSLLPTGVSGLIDGFPIHVYMNGEDMGLYTWNIPKKGWLFNMDPENPNHILFSAEKKSGACLFEGESNSNNSWDLVFSGGTGDERDKLNRMIRFVKDSSIEDFRDHFDEYLDFDSVVNYYVFSHIVAHIDGHAKNMLLATFDGEIWYTGLYDMDSLFGLRWTGKKIVPVDVLYNPETSADYTPFNSSVLWSKLEQAFGNEIYERYIELSSNELSYDNIIAEFAYFMDGVGQELYDADDRIWTDRSEKYPSIPSRDFKLDQIKAYMQEREPYTRAWMESLRTE